MSGMLTPEKLAWIRKCVSTEDADCDECPWRAAGCSDDHVSALLSHIAALTAENERLNRAIWEKLYCGEVAPLQCDVPTCSGRYLCKQISEGWTPPNKEASDASL